MAIYAIKPPYISNGLKRSYNKQIEVFEYSDKIDESNRHEYIRRFFYKNGKWETDHKSTRAPYIRKGVHIYDEIIMHHTNGNYECFSELEMAQASKFILIERMAKEYEREIKHLHELFKRNVPDVSDEIQQIKKVYPELFI